MSNKFVQQFQVVTQATVRPATSLAPVAFFDAAGHPINPGAAPAPAAANADVATANATDLASAEALANQLKTSFNSLQAKLRTAGFLS